MVDKNPWQNFLSSLKERDPLETVKRKFPDDIPQEPVGASCLSFEFAKQLKPNAPVDKWASDWDGKRSGLRQNSSGFEIDGTGDTVLSNVGDNQSKPPRGDEVISSTNTKRTCEGLPTWPSESGDSTICTSDDSGKESQDLNKLETFLTEDISPCRTQQPYRDTIPPLPPEQSHSPRSVPRTSPSKTRRPSPSRGLDSSLSASQWSLEMFQRYFDLKKHVFELRFDLKIFPKIHESNTSTAMSDLYQDIQKLLFWQSSEWKKESNIRVLLDCLLLRLCKLHDLYLQTEEECKLTYLPTCRFDYLILNKEHAPIGCVEAKRPSSFDEKAFVQSVLEMCVVQQLAAHKNVNTETTPVFCVLSDGRRFVVMQLKGRELLLEHDWSPGESVSDENVNGKLKIRVLKNETDFTSLVNILSILISKKKHQEI